MSPCRAPRERLQALGGAVGAPVGVAGQASPAASGGQLLDQLGLASPTLIVTHSVSSNHFM
jgi:hypothetical protein